MKSSSPVSTVPAQDLYLHQAWLEIVVPTVQSKPKELPPDHN